MTNKRGSHVGMILSFVIFITFIIFLYVVVQPVMNTGEDKKATLEYLEIEIIRNVSTNLTSTTVEINSEHNPEQECVRLQVFLVLSEILPQTIVQNELKNVLDIFTNSIGDLGVYRTSSSNRFFRVYSSQEFPTLTDQGTPPLCTNVNDEDYTIGSIKTGKYIFKKRLYKLVDYYNSNYENLRNELKIPPGNEFGFGFVESDGTKVEVEQETKSANVYAKEIPIQYIDDQANIQSGFINIKVW